MEAEIAAEKAVRYFIFDHDKFEALSTYVESIEEKATRQDDKVLDDAVFALLRDLSRQSPLKE